MVRGLRAARTRGRVREYEPEPRRGSVFKRLENDAEFWARVAPGALFGPPRDGAELDDYVWVNRKKQRRIIEDER